MKKSMIVAGLLTLGLTAGMAAISSQDPPAQPPPGREARPELPPPQTEPEWLQKRGGDWTSESEMLTGPDQPPMKATGTDSVRSLGGRWIICDISTDTPMGTIKAVMTLGYSPEKGKDIGTWVDSITDILWVYEGTMDPTGTILTLEAEGPNMMDPGKTAKYRDVIEMKNNDLRTLTSYAQGDDGQWIKFGTGTLKRKK
ncbi:MAG: DUF1579 family protein [Phycisphaerales bacterium]|nr:DUF1579 family protein [Phycisphaerales bacterium]